MLGKPLTEPELESLKSQTIVVVHRDASKFALNTPGRAYGTLPLAAAGFFGSLADIGISSTRAHSAGEKLLAEQGIEDPAISITRRLFEDLQSLGGFGDLRLLEATQPVRLYQPADFKRLAPKGALVLDVRTTDWLLSFIGGHWKRYRLFYEVRARLIDPWRDRELVIAKSKFYEKYKDSEEAPTLDQLLADDASLLKAKLQQATRKAMDELRSGLLPASALAALEDNDMKDFATRYTAAWCSQDPASVAAFFAENGSLKINDGAPSVGRAAITEAARGFMSAFPDMVVAMDGLERRGDGFIYRWTLTGTNTGPGGTGSKVRIGGYEEWTIGKDGLVAASLGHFDAADYDRQLAGKQ